MDRINLGVTRRAVLGAAAFSAGLGPLRAATQEPYPGRAVSLLVALQAGSASDVASRLVSDRLGNAWRQPVVVENLPGAGGVLGATRLFNAKPDGYTLGALNNGVVCVLPHLASRPPQDFTQLEPVAMIADLPSVLVVGESVPARSLPEFLDLARRSPGRLFYGSPGVGSPQHIAMEMLNEAAGVNLVHVPFKGGPQAVNDVVGGQVHATWIAIPVAAGFIKSGQLRALATGGTRRSSLLPDIPTLREGGVTGFEYLPWMGFFAPPRTPRDVVLRLNKAVQEVLAQPAVSQQLLASGVEARPMQVEPFSRRVKSERAAMVPVVKRLALG